MAYFRIKHGDVVVTYDGSKEFLEQVIPKLVSQVGDKVQKMASEPIPEPVVPAKPKRKKEDSLLKLIELQPKDTQVRRFLCAAALIQVNQKGKLTTSKVNELLIEEKLSKLTNASDSLNQNIRKGFCDRPKPKGSEFFVTPKGLKEVGLGRVV